VHVRGGKRFAFVIQHKARTWNGGHAKSAAARIGSALQRPPGRLQGFAIWIVGAERRLAYDMPRGDEARDIVDMTIGVVVLEAAVQPDDLLRAEGMAKSGFGFRLRPTVAVRVKKHLARRENRALAVMLNGAAFQHESEFADRRAGQVGNLVANWCIVGQVELASPAIALESERNGALSVPRKDRTRIAEPDVSVFRRHHLGRLSQARPRPRFIPTPPHP